MNYFKTNENYCLSNCHKVSMPYRQSCTRYLVLPDECIKGKLGVETGNRPVLYTYFKTI